MIDFDRFEQSQVSSKTNLNAALWGASGMQGILERCTILRCKSRALVLQLEYEV